MSAFCNICKFVRASIILATSLTGIHQVTLLNVGTLSLQHNIADDCNLQHMCELCIQNFVGHFVYNHGSDDITLPAECNSVGYLILAELRMLLLPQLLRYSHKMISCRFPSQSHQHHHQHHHHLLLEDPPFPVD